MLPGTFRSSPGCTSSLANKKLWKGAENTAATSFASRRGIRDFSASASVLSSSASECKNATHGRTPSSVFARFVGSWHRCSTRNGGGSFLSSLGSPISSYASRRAVWKGVSDSVSAFPMPPEYSFLWLRYLRDLPPGRAACPGSYSHISFGVNLSLFSEAGRLLYMILGYLRALSAPPSDRLDGPQTTISRPRPAEIEVKTSTPSAEAHMPSSAQWLATSGISIAISFVASYNIRARRPRTDCGSL